MNNTIYKLATMLMGKEKFIINEGILLLGITFNIILSFYKKINIIYICNGVQ